MSLVSNRFEIQNLKEDVGVCLSFEDLNTVIVKLFSFSKKGWDSFQIKLFSRDEKESIILDIPDLKEFSAELTFKVNFLIEQEEKYTQKIPFKIIQTNSVKNIQTKKELLQNTVAFCKALNPEYDLEFFSDIDCREFIKQNQGNLPESLKDLLKAYDTIIPGAFKADIFRYVYLYLRGGIYLDNKIIPRVPFRKIIEEDTELLLCADYERTNSYNISNCDSIYTGIIVTMEKNPLFLVLLKECILNILSKQEYFIKDVDERGYTGILSLTGPKLFYSCLYTIPNFEQYIRLKHFIKDNQEDLYSNFIINSLATKELVLTKSFTTEVPLNHYSKYWINKLLFFTNIIEDEKYFYLVYPHFFPDVFDFEIKNRYIIAKREAPWGLDLSVRILEKETSKYSDVFIGRSNSSTKAIYLTNLMFESQEKEPSNVFYLENLSEDDIKVQKMVIAITSVIQTSDFCIGINEPRSLISPEDRYLQTIEQIERTREKAPSATIILLESSPCLEKEKILELSKRVDYLILLFKTSENTLAYQYCHKHWNKSLGEIYSMTKLGELLKNKDFDWFFKLNGRYKFQEDFSLQPFLTPEPTVACVPAEGKFKYQCQTVFYSVPKKYYNLYIEHFLAWLEPSTSVSVEEIYMHFLISLKKFNIVDKLKISGIGATHGKLIYV